MLFFFGSKLAVFDFDSLPALDESLGALFVCLQYAVIVSRSPIYALGLQIVGLHFFRTAVHI